MPRQLLGTAIASNTITTTQLQTTVVNQISAGGGPRVSSLIYPGDDTAANTVGGQTVYVVGSGFAANANVYINGNAVPSISFISASNLAITTPALSAATYPVYVINPETGATAIHIPGLRVSGDPTWVTSAGSLTASQDEASAWSYTVSATSDSAVTYALAGGSSLPSGISLAANGLISGTLSSPPGTETTYNFTVEATDAENQNATRAFSVTVSSGEGVLFANNVLLIHADGTNNKNNHAFLDSSNNNFTITRAGNATQGSFSPFSQTGWSNYFDGTGDYLTFPSDAAFGFGTGDITIECWFYHTSRSTTATLFSNANDTLNLYINTSGVFGVYDGSVRNSSQTVPLNSWNHFAYVRSSGTAKLYYNGTQVLSFSSSTNYGTSAARVGVNYGGGSGSDYATGFISNLRVLKGTALYTSTFTPPTTPLTAVSNTQLLSCQSNRFRDASNNNFTITRNGDVSVQPFSPFAPTAEYSTANVGGSGYFDGSGDYLTVPAGSAFAPGTGDFTIEAWVYPTTNSIDQYIWTQTVSGTNYFLFTISSTAALVMTPSGGGTPINGPANSIRPFAWNHVAAVRSGGTVTVYVNGVAGTPTTNTQDLTNTSLVPTIGTYTHSTSSSPLNGYITSLRYVKGTAVYTTNFTPSTTPLTNIANTSFLCNFTNAGIFDQTAKNVLETVGDAKVSTAQYKYGTASMYFDGTGDWLDVVENPIQRIGTGDFTIETWVYTTTDTGMIFNKGWSTPGGYGGWIQTGNVRIRFYDSVTNTQTNIITTNNPISLNTWHHIAFVRSSNTVTIYVNGNSVSNGSFSGDINSTSKFRIGANWDSTLPLNGYLDDLRITRGYARYTSNFTPPTSAFKDK